MRVHLAAVFAVLFIAGSARPASAGWLLTPFAGVTMGGATGYFDPDDAAGRSKLAMGVSVTRTGRRFSFEGELVSVPGFFTVGGDGLITSSSVLSLSANALVNLPSLGRVHPYAIGGIGGVRVNMTDEAGVFPVSEWQPAANLGAGVFVPLSPRFSVRADGRYARTRTGDGAESSIGFGETYVSFWRVTAGLAIGIR